MIPSALVSECEPLARRLFDAMRERTHDGIGITRASYGEGEQYAHNLMAETARELGLEVERDAALNTYMTMPGRDRSAPRVMIGSHLDSVAQGGNFDGAAGVVAGLTALAALKRAGHLPTSDITVMGIRAEESAWFGTSYIGSRAALGVLPDGALDGSRRADTGRTLAEHIAEAGGDLDRLRSGPPHLDTARIRAFLEPHIEQGPVLETDGLPLGIVTGIRGNRRLPKAVCRGEYSHCGGVPRSHRRDTVIAVSDLVMALDRIWDETEAAGGDFAFTVGRFATDPARHAMTIIAGEVGFSLDMRSLDGAFLDAMESRVRDIAAGIERRRGVIFDLGDFTRAAPGILDEGLRAGLRAGAEALGVPHMDIPSGASHDSAALAAAGVPTAMLFIRNANGSHNPDEAMEIADFMATTQVLTRWLEQHA